MNLPSIIHESDPSFLCDLLDGLLAIPESQWRAFTLEHYPDDERERGGRLQLEWLGFGQSQLLLMQLQNTLDSMRSMLASHWSGKKVDSVPVLPPGVHADSSVRGRVDGSHVTSLKDYMADVRRCFLG